MTPGQRSFHARLAKLEAGAEPYWMQDIRLAQRRIDEARARLRAAQSGSSPEA